MQKLFNKILIPVDISNKSKDILDKAIAFAAKYHCRIQLLHVVSVSPFAAIAGDGHLTLPYDPIDNMQELEFQLEKLCRYIDFSSGDIIDVEYSIINGTWNQGIIDFVNANNIDLVLIGEKSNFLKKRKMVVNPDLIAEKTNIPVITIPSNRRLTRLYSIVIPITDFLPVRKLMYGVYIAVNLDTTIKLLGIENMKTKDKVHYYLEKAHQLIKENCNIRIEKEIVVSQNIAEAVKQFALHECADLIIVNPGTQTKMPGFFSSLLGNIIQKYAAPPVLTINRV